VLGDLVHAVLVRDAGAIEAIQTWHATTQPGALVLLPVHPGPNLRAPGPHPLTDRLRVDGPASVWVDALVGGSEVLETTGRVLRRPSGAIYLGGAAGPTGPLRRRADLAQLGQDVTRQEQIRAAAGAALEATHTRLLLVEQEAQEAALTVARAQDAEREAIGVRDDAQRLLATVRREVTESAQQFDRIRERLGQAEHRLSEVDARLTDSELSRVRLEEALAAGRAGLSELEADLESAREARLHWQVQEAHLGARLRSAAERLERATVTLEQAQGAAGALTAELTRLQAETAELDSRRARWEEEQAALQGRLQALELASGEAEATLAAASERLLAEERVVADLRARTEEQTEEHHRLALELTEVAATRRRIRDRVETEWHAPLDQLLQGVQLLELETAAGLEAEAERIVAALDAIGPVNPLAVEEHAEETRRLEFLTGQRDDLVAARQSLLQAIREIDGTARAMFVETFQAIQQHFMTVFTTLFGGGECQLRLATPEDPLESEIEIHAAPRGKRTQRIHLLSSGERTLVATSLLFAIYLTKPSPFCLMDEVDAPLDDANVGRFTTLLSEFKDRTQFIVITHNPRTMQAADAVYGVTMQEPGVSTIVGVRLAEFQPAEVRV
jgi:chromosome segregation protein